jgi:PAS domain S-box-containing protein
MLSPRPLSSDKMNPSEHLAKVSSSALLSAIVMSSEDAIISKTTDGVVTSWNPGAERIFGYSATEIIGRTLQVIIQPEKASEEERILATIGRGEPIMHYETERLHKDGARIIVDVTISPIRDDEGKVVGASKVARDITARRAENEERRRIEAKLVETAKLESLGVLAGGIAHDFNNLLTGILGNASLARQVLKPDSVGQPMLDQIERAAHRAAELC